MVLEGCRKGFPFQFAVPKMKLHSEIDLKRVFKSSMGVDFYNGELDIGKDSPRKQTLGDFMHKVTIQVPAIKTENTYISRSMSRELSQLLQHMHI